MDDKMNLECSHPLVKKVFFNGNASLYDPKIYFGLTVCLEEGDKEFVKTFVNESGDEVDLINRANDFLDKSGFWLNNDKGVSIFGGTE